MMRYVNSFNRWIKMFLSFIFVLYPKNTHENDFGSNLVLIYLPLQQQKKLQEINNLVIYQKGNPFQVSVLIIYLSGK